jgi:hypothetical protein
MVYKPAGFSTQELRRLIRLWPSQSRKRNVIYAKQFQSDSNDFARAIEERLMSSDRILTDDRPYLHPITLRSIFGNESNKKNRELFYDRLRIYAVFFIGGVCLLLFLLHSFGKAGSNPLPLSYQGYFILTGFAYMFLQIGLIAKFDLFLGNPLYSMALIISIFLIANSLGSISIHTYHHRVKAFGLSLAAFFTTFGTLILSQFLVRHMISLPLWLKILLVTAATFPIGFLLGTFSPMAS